MDPRLAIHAGSPARQKVSAWLAALAVLSLASPAAAAPKGAPAKAAFDRGVAQYQKGNFAAASEQLAASFKLEADPETLFAWAQTELQLERCDKAIELFEKLLAFNLPPENKKVIASKIDECKAILAKQPANPKQPEKTPEKQPEKQPEKTPEQPPESPASGPADPGTPPVADGPTTGPARSPWWKDPIGDTLVLGGVAGLVVGGLYLRSSQSKANDLDQKPPPNDREFGEAKDRIDSHGKIGVISATVGGVLLVGGIVRYATRGGGGSKERTAVTGWISPDGGGFAAIGRF
jgi:tetratricopeptide (TPR) repeat protein